MVIVVVILIRRVAELVIASVVVQVFGIACAIATAIGLVSVVAKVTVIVTESVIVSDRHGGVHSNRTSTRDCNHNLEW